MALADAQITAQERLRAAAGAGVLAAWNGLGHYDREDVPRFLRVVSPLVLAAQRQSVALTSAYVARAVGGRPIGLPTDQLIGASVRAGVPDAERWQRPFVNVWTALQKGEPWEQAVESGRARAVGMARMDVQLSQRAAYAAVQQAEPRIAGYRRKADPGACAFCLLVNGAFVKSASAMPLHPDCGCGLEPILSDAPHVDDQPPEGVRVVTHGELGPMLVDPQHTFTHL